MHGTARPVRAHLPARERLPTLTGHARAADEAILESLRHAPLQVRGRPATASNVAVLVELERPAATGGPLHAIYKPVSGERPLWDFPEGTLAGREVAVYLIARAGGWDLVPPTTMRVDGELTGSIQRWIGDPYAADTSLVVDVVSAGTAPEGMLAVLDGVDAQGREIEVVHEDRDDVRSMAVFDALINNSDRKGSHCVRDAAGHLWGFDHGVSLHHEPKLRTILWGWAGEPLPDADIARIERVREGLDGTLGADLAELLPATDLEALGARARALLETRTHPEPRDDWPSVPWPPI